MSDNKKMLELYTLAELAYEKHFQSSVDNIETLYPDGWHEKKNYKQKIEIITQAIKENILIENTTKYQDSIEGVKNILVKE